MGTLIDQPLSSLGSGRLPSFNTIRPTPSNAYTSPSSIYNGSNIPNVDKTFFREEENKTSSPRMLHDDDESDISITSSVKQTEDLSESSCDESEEDQNEEDNGQLRDQYDQTKKPEGQQQSKLRLREWLKNKVDSRSIPGLDWLDSSSGIFRISWKHGSMKEWSPEVDAKLFKEWAMYAGRDTEKSNSTQWKATFRCALNTLPGIKELKDKRVNKGRDPFRVYQFTNETSKNKRTKKVISQAYLRPKYREDSDLIKNEVEHNQTALENLNPKNDTTHKILLLPHHNNLSQLDHLTHQFHNDVRCQQPMYTVARQTKGHNQDLYEQQYTTQPETINNTPPSHPESHPSISETVNISTDTTISMTTLKHCIRKNKRPHSSSIRSSYIESHRSFIPSGFLADCIDSLDATCYSTDIEIKDYNAL